MTGIERLESVVRKLILPHYPMLDDVEVLGIEENGKMNYSFLTYFSEDILPSKLRDKIGDETRSLYEMIGEGPGSELTIYFKDNK